MCVPTVFLQLFELKLKMPILYKESFIKGSDLRVKGQRSKIVGLNIEQSIYY